MYTASYITAKVLKEKGYKKAYCMAMDGLRHELEEVGIEVIGCEDDKDKVFD